MSTGMATDRRAEPGAEIAMTTANFNEAKIPLRPIRFL
jgi:hypothetical protein